MIRSLITILFLLGSSLVLGQVTEKHDVPYVSQATSLQKLDIYTPGNHAKRLPVLIHFHGGGWRFGDKKKNKRHGRFYAQQGIVFISANYRLSPDVQHPAHIKDCAAAVAWIFNHLDDLGGDSKRIFVSGHSAGAHLAALLATDPVYLTEHKLHPGKLAGVIPVDVGMYDLESRLQRRRERMVKSMIRDAFGDDTNSLQAASPINHLSAGNRYPKFLIPISAKRDVAVSQGKQFANKLNSMGGQARVILVEGHSHRAMNKGMYDANDPVAKAILGFILTGRKKINHPDVNPGDQN